MNPTPEPDAAWEYEPAPELTRPEISSSYGLFIDGEFVKSASGKTMKTSSPSTEEVLSEVGVAGAEDIDRAVTAARAASVKWRRIAPRERAKYLFRIARRIQERARELAVLESMDV